MFPAGSGGCPTLASTEDSTTHLSPDNLSTMATAFTSASSILPASTTVAGGASRTYKFTVGIASGANNGDQGLAATQPITFTFAQ